MSPGSLSDLARLEERLRYTFRDRTLLERALRHPSSGGANYQRLEFLGDAVLGHAVARMLFERFPELDEGRLTRLRSLMVRSVSLSQKAAELDLGEMARVGRSEQENRDRPALLEDLFEAVVGAIELDGGWEAARHFIEACFKAEVDALDPDDLLRADPKSALQEAAQARGIPVPEYRDLRATGPDHRTLWRVEVLWDGRPLAEGEGRTKKQAQKEAARRALERLRLLD